MTTEEEDFYFKLFAKTFSIPFEKWDRPPRGQEDGQPDFFIHLGEKKVGIEMTQYVIPKIRRDIEFRNKIIDLAERKHNEMYATSAQALTGWIYVYMRRDIDEQMKKECLKQEDIAERLAQFVSKLEGGSKTKGPFQHYEDLQNHGLDDFFHEVTVHAEPTFSRLIWQNHNHAFRSADLSDGNVILNFKDYVDKNKETKAINYLKYCDECWLLVIGSVGGNYSPIRISKEDIPKTENKYQRVFDNSLFRRILFFDSRWVVNLK
jgi:hypothetical protein